MHNREREWILTELARRETGVAGEPLKPTTIDWGLDAAKSEIVGFKSASPPEPGSERIAARAI